MHVCLHFLLEASTFLLDSNFDCTFAKKISGEDWRTSHLKHLLFWYLLRGSTKKTVQVDRDRKFRPSAKRIRHHVTNLYLFNIFNNMFWFPTQTNQLRLELLIPGFQKCQPHMSNGNPCIFHVPRVGMSTFKTPGTAWPTINGRFHRPKGLPAQLAIFVLGGSWGPNVT